ncbi:MAG: family channel protein [Nocardioides sp.]|nr:family channel protein [Nocardioides sp.]
MSDTPTLGQKVGAEALGTFVLVFFGCATAVLSGDYAATGLAFGLSLLAMIYAFGRISGGHFNPAVSVGAALGGRMAWSQVLVYVGAQLVGAIVAGAVLFGILHGFEGYDSDSSVGQNFFGDQNPVADVSVWSALALELVMTAVFVWVILAVTDERNEHPALAPLAIGLALAMIHFASLNATGTSVNPARSIGPALFAGSEAIGQLWVFIVAPLLGGAVAGLTYPLIFGRSTEPIPGSGLRFGRGASAAVPGYGALDQYQQQWNQQDPQAQAGAQQGEQAWTLEQAAAQGWHWDEQAQQWRHVSEGYQPGQQGDQQGWAQEPQQQWPDPSQDDGRTQVRQPPSE